MSGVDPQAFCFAIDQIKDGFIFEKFAQGFLSKVLGYNFLPAGGIKDKGIDGLEHMFNREGFERDIYQMSIDKHPREKIVDTLEKLKSNSIRFNRLIYVTNISVKNKDVLIDEFFDIYKKYVQIYDQQWFAVNVNNSTATVQAYHIFVDSYLHEFAKPGATFEIADFETDPRVYAFLRQQWEENRGQTDLSEVLVDSLILLALEGTDPSQGSMQTKEQIIKKINELIKFDPRSLHNLIDTRLRVLSTRPRKINYHRIEDAYVLQYEQRIAIQERNLRDAALQKTFREDTKLDLEKYFDRTGLSLHLGIQLVESVLHELFYQQGLDFSKFIMTKDNTEAFEKNLPDIVSKVVEKKNYKSETKNALLQTIRNMVYNGTDNQQEFLDRLSHTYLMMFLLQCDPQVAKFFATLASKLQVYVDTSIIIPAISEHFLDARRQRYKNLLIGGRRAGVSLYINEPILRELCAHFKMIKGIYQENYAENEDIYTDDINIFYIQQIMIRSFFYARLDGRVNTWKDFLDALIGYNLRESLVEFLKEEFGIKYIPDSKLGIEIDITELDRLSEHLADHKDALSMVGRFEKAKTDAEVILMIYKLREMNNELGSGGIFGYTTWWLSSDVKTHRSVLQVFGEKYSQSCYMRPDFLYNYISLAPSLGEVNEAFAKLFPTLVGVNISYRVPEEVTETIHAYTKSHRNFSKGRVKGALRELSDKLKHDSQYKVKNKVTSFLDEQLADLQDAS